EVQDVFFLPRPLDWNDLHPDPLEVPAVALVLGSTLLDLASGALAIAQVEGAFVRPDHRLTRQPIELRSDRLMPRWDYYRRVVRFTRRLAVGWRPRRRAWW